MEPREEYGQIIDNFSKVCDSKSFPIQIIVCVNNKVVLHYPDKIESTKILEKLESTNLIKILIEKKKIVEKFLEKNNLVFESITLRFIPKENNINYFISYIEKNSKDTFCKTLSGINFESQLPYIIKNSPISIKGSLRGI